MPPTLLLLQARLPDDPMAAHERRCFAQQAKLPLKNVVCHDLLGGPPDMAQLQEHDALTVGGSGDYYVTHRDLPHFDEFLAFLREVVDVGHPTFASCFGYQCIAAALGGELVHDPENTEVGTYPLTLTEEGARDPLLGSLPAGFNAQLGHKDRVVSLPDGVINLASSARSPHQALRVVDKPIWATQFHPELDRETNLDRFFHYLQSYAKSMDEEEQKAAEERFAESDEVSGLLGRFFELVDGKN